MYSEDMNELYQVAWRPQSITQHPLENPLNPAPAPHSSALKYMETVKTPSKPVGAYRPPGARGTATPLAFKREDEGGAAYVRDGISSTSGGVVNGFGKAKRQVPGAETVEALPPGAAQGGGVSLATAGAGDENLSKAALKNKKKREAKKAKEAEAQGAGLAAPAATNGHGAETLNPEKREHARSRSRNGMETPRGQSRRRDTNRQHAPPPPPQLSTPAPAPMEAPGLSVTSPDGGTPQDKKIRALHKKLRAIDDLKMRQAGGEKLEATQISKITTEEGVRKELQALGFTE